MHLSSSCGSVRVSGNALWNRTLTPSPTCVLNDSSVQVGLPNSASVALAALAMSSKESMSVPSRSNITPSKRLIAASLNPVEFFVGLYSQRASRCASRCVSKRDSRAVLGAGFEVFFWAFVGAIFRPVFDAIEE